VIPETGIWRAAQVMLKQYGDKALEQSAARADELAAHNDYDGQATWHGITEAVRQLANMTPPGPPQQNFFPQADRSGPIPLPPTSGFILDNRFFRE
jgi:hypothetical protein